MVAEPPATRYVDQSTASITHSAIGFTTSVSPRPARCPSGTRGEQGSRIDLTPPTHGAFDPLRPRAAVERAPAEWATHRSARLHLLDTYLSVNSVEVPNRLDVAIGVAIAHVPGAAPVRSAIGPVDGRRVGHRVRRSCGVCGNTGSRERRKAPDVSPGSRLGLARSLDNLRGTAGGGVGPRRSRCGDIRGRRSAVRPTVDGVVCHCTVVRPGRPTLRCGVVERLGSAGAVVGVAGERFSWSDSDGVRRWSCKQSQHCGDHRGHQGPDPATHRQRLPTDDR
ncbi:hypothetical protein FHR89_000752 [Cellulomonas uda]|nr:hypothetical protein [Cellulomonas uda]